LANYLQDELSNDMFMAVLLDTVNINLSWKNNGLQRRNSYPISIRSQTMSEEWHDSNY
jgi:hypothetical protein